MKSQTIWMITKRDPNAERAKEVLYREVGSSLLHDNALAIPEICQFWYTTALFRPVKVHQKEHNLRQNSQKKAKFRVLFAKKYASLKVLVVVVYTNISYIPGPSIHFFFILSQCDWPLKVSDPATWALLRFAYNFTPETQVSSLEPFLEALPSLSVMSYISLTDPDFFSSSANFTRQQSVTTY